MNYKISLLDYFQKLPNQDSICNFILTNNNIQNYKYSKIFALILLEKSLQNKWDIYNKNEKINFLNFLTNLLIDNITSKVKFKNKFFTNKLNKIIILIAKKEITGNWNSFIKDICSSSMQNLSLFENNLKILIQLIEEINEFWKYSLTSVEKIKLKEYLNNEIEYIYNLCEYILIHSKEMNLQILKNCIELLTVCIPYFSQNKIASKQFTELLLNFLKEKNLRNYIIKYINELFSFKLINENQNNIELYDNTIFEIYKSFIINIYDITQTSDLSQLYKTISSKKIFGFEKFILIFENCLINFFQKNINYILKFNLPKEESSNNDFIQNNSKNLTLGLEYLFNLLKIENKQIFFYSLDFFNWFILKIFFSKELNYPIEQYSSLKNIEEFEPYINFIKISSFYSILYLPFFNKLRIYLITNMKRPNEIKTKININGDIVYFHQNEISEIMTNSLILLTYIDIKETIKVLENKFKELYENVSFNINLLNSLCWSFGAISNIIDEIKEENIIIIIIRYLLDLCVKVKGIENKTICAQNLLYVINRYPKFLNNHWKFLKSCINRLINFLHEFELRDLACKTFLNISKNCGNQLIIIKKDEIESFITQLIRNISINISDLKDNQKLIIYETIGNIINHEKDFIKKKSLMEQFINFFHDNWIDLIKRVQNNIQLLKNKEIYKSLNNIILINYKLFQSMKNDYVNYFSEYFDFILQAFEFYTKEINNFYNVNILSNENISFFILINKNIIDLLCTLISNINDKNIINNNLFPQFERIIKCYSNIYNKEPYILQLFKILISKKQDSEKDKTYIQLIWNNLCLPTINLIKNDLQKYEKHIQFFFDILYLLLQYKFEYLMKVQQYKFNNDVIDIIIDSMKINHPNFVQKSIQILLLIFKSVNEKKCIENVDINIPFYMKYYLNIFSFLFSNLINSINTYGFKEKLEILQIQIQMIQDNILNDGILQIKTKNKQIVIDIIFEEISKKSKYIHKEKINNFCEQLFNNCHNFHNFKILFRDLIITIK